MSKTLIYLNQNELNPAGGPNGVGYYLFEEITKRKLNDNFVFLNEQVHKKQKSKAPRFIKYLGRVVLNFKYYRALLRKKPKSITIDFNDYDVIHFHSTQSMYEAREQLREYKGVVLLTSHSPVPLHKEILSETISGLEKLLFHFLYKDVSVIDEYAFKRADYITFPCKESEESYYKNWDKYSSIRVEEKILYIPTGISTRVPGLSKDTFLNKYGLTPDSFKLCFVGRHSKIKGYDKAKEIFKLFNNKHSNVEMVVAGREKPLRGLNQNNWKEIGFTKDPYSLIKYSDVFILPNKETYFDLVILEALSLGAIIVTTRTGGNKLFGKINAEGVLLFNDESEALDQIERVYNMTSQEKMALRQSNMNLFNSYFSSEMFFDNYEKIINFVTQNR